MASRTDADLLRSVPIFSNCTTRELRALFKVLKPIHFKAGRVICEEGETGLGLHIISEGKAKVQVKGRTRATIGPGDFFGEVALLDGGPRTATVIAATNVEGFALPVWQFKNVLKEYPSITFKMLEVVAQRLRSTTSAIEC